MARLQHYEFAHHILPEEIWLDTTHAWSLLGDPVAAPPLLAEWWRMAHAYSGATDEPLPAAGLLVAPCRVGGGAALLFTLPTPTEAGEAWLALLVLGDLGAPRYFLLEAEGADLTTTRIGERRPEADTHVGHGPGPTAGTAGTGAAFVAMVEQLV